MVKEVVALRAEDDLDLLMQSLSLLKDRICVDEARAVKLFPMNRHILVEWSIGKSLHRWSGNLAPSCHDRSTAGGVGRSNEFWTVQQTCVEVIYSATQIERETTLHLLNT